MTYINDRRMVETLTIPLAFSMVLVTGVSPEFKETKETVLDLLTDIMNNAIGNMEPKRRDKILRRSRAAMEAGYLKEAKENNTHAAKIGLALYYFVNNLINQDAFYFNEGSKFEEVLNHVLPALEEWANIDKFDKSSFKEARRMLERYQAAGYFGDVLWTIER